MSIVTGSETVVLAPGNSATVFAHCPAASVVAGCSFYAAKPYALPYRVFPRDQDTCEATFLNISGAEHTLELRVIAHCVLTSG